MCMIEYADESFRVYKHALRHAHREHLCSECGRTIQRREVYEYASGLHPDGGWMHFRTCENCISVRRWLVAECGGFLHEGVLEDLAEHLDEVDAGRRGLLELAVAYMRRQWRSSDGRLMDPL